MENIFTRAARFIRERKMTRRWKRVITVLAAAVVFCTTYALILPAMTAERQPSCGMEEHTHTEECFEDGIQVCGKEEHTHTEECYPKSTGLIVGVITRDQSSDTGTGTQGTGSDGSAGTQADGNTGAQNGGNAGAVADGNTGTQADGAAGAGQDTGNGQQAEGQPEAAPVPEAKTPDQLAQELGSLTLNGTWAEDTVAVAKAHERCREDSRAFVQAVLSYSGVQGMPDVSDGAGGYLGYAEWIRKLREAGLYSALSGNIPEAGDLVFLDQEENAEKLGHEDERVDHVGILVNVRTRGENGETLRDLMVLTAGADGLVGSSFYSMEDASNVTRIAGYAKLPEQPREEPAEVLTEGQTEETKETEAGTEAPEAGAVPEANTEKSADEDMETKNDTEISSDGDTKTPEEATESGTEPAAETETATEPTPGETAETGTETELSSETDTELTTETAQSPEAAEDGTELTTEENTETETDTELLPEEDTEIETDTEVSSEEDTETETDTELSSEEESEMETGTELSSEKASETETGTEESESNTDDWGWTWEDFAGQDAEEEESETDWDDYWYEDETEEETEGGNPEVDTETSEDWEASVSDVELTGIWADDLTAVAQTQVGEKESTENYQIGKDGVQRGITRYGQWYGEPYGDWDAMFVSFCLNYAEVPHSSVPRAGSCTALAEMLKVYGSYAEPEEYKEAAKGDLVFLDTDADEVTDHVGILTEATEEGLTVIAGDVEDEVKSLTYAKGDAAVLGYGILPQKPAQKLYHKVYNDGNVAVTAEYTAEAMIPEQAVLVAREIPQDDEKYQEHYKTVREMMDAEKASETEDGIQAVPADGETETETETETEEELYLKIYNIGFYLDEQRIKPQAEVKISIEFPNDPGFTSGTNRVIRMEDGKEPEALDVTNTGEEVEFSAKPF